MPYETTSPSSQTNSGLAPWMQAGARALLRHLALRDNVTFDPPVRVGRGVVVSAPHHLHIGAESAIGPRTIIQVNGRIGEFVLIGMAVQIVGRDDHALHEIGTPIGRATWVGNRGATPRDSVNIDRDVWIGGSSVVLSGISIGHSAVVAAGSVVTQDVPAFCIVGGNPARPLGWRFHSDAERTEHIHALARRVELKI